MYIDLDTRLVYTSEKKTHILGYNKIEDALPKAIGNAWFFLSEPVIVRYAHIIYVLQHNKHERLSLGIEYVEQMD